MDTSASRILERVDHSSRSIVQRLQLLQDIGSALSAEHDLGRLLDMILRESRRLIQADSGSIYLRGDDIEIVEGATAAEETFRSTPFLLLKIAQNDSIRFPFKEMRLPFDEKTVAGHVAVSGSIVNLEDVYHIPAGAAYSYNTSFDEASGYRSKSMLVVPMKNRDGEVIGVLQLINKKIEPDVLLDEPGRTESLVTAFDPVDEELVLSLASQAAICIERTRLYEEIEGMFEGLVTSFTLSLEKRNKTTSGHSKRVAGYAVGVARAVNRHSERLGVSFSPEELKQLRYAALLHDIGKIGVPEAVLDKRNKLTDSELETVAYRFHYWMARLLQEKGKGAETELIRLEEWLEAIRGFNIPKPLDDEGLAKLDEIRAARFTDVDGAEKPLLSDREYENLAVRRGNLTGIERQQIERHVIDTWEVLKRITWPKDLHRVPHLAATHHEKINGKGYPWGLQEEKIPLGGKILAIVDIYEALTATDRPYKPPMPVQKALDIVRGEVDRGGLDRTLFDLFVEEKVHLMYTGETGFVKAPKFGEHAGSTARADSTNG